MARPAAHLAPALALLLALGACGSDGGRPRNLLWIVLDTTRADHLGTYGYGRDTSPAIDALAREGTVFEHAFSQSTLTPVSAGSFLTGTYPFRHGVRSLWIVEKEKLAPEVPTLAELLGRAGLSTAGFVSAFPMRRHYGLDRGFELYQDRVPHQQGHCGSEDQRRSDETTDLALDWLDANGRRPFFALVHYFDVHDATLAPPREFLRERVSFQLPNRPERPCWLAGVKRPEQRIELYDAEIAFMDRQVARLVERLERIGARDDTLIVVMADHGEGLGQHDFWTHGLLFDEQLRVPLILAGPGVPRGARIEQTVRLVDLPPTLAELFDVSFGAAPVDGVSLVPLLSGSAPPPDEVYAEVHHAAGDRLKRDTEMYALRSGDWKLVYRPTHERHELYDLASDPGELVNLYRPDHPMAIELIGRIASLGAVDGRVYRVEDVDPEMQQMLEGTGYAGGDEEEDEAGGERPNGSEERER